MAYPKDLLTADEDLVLDLRPHWWFLAPSVAGVLVTLAMVSLAIAYDAWPPVQLVTAGLVCLAVVMLVWRWLQWSTTNFVVTNERVISRTGVISKKGLEIPLDRINTVFFNQTVFERIIGAGDLGIESAGEGGRQDFHDIRRPNLVQNEIYRQAERLEARRLHLMGEAAAQAQAQPAEPSAAAPSIPEQIDTLAKLHQQGVLTDAEFEAKKTELLNRM